jgi:hypothetical protein
VTEPGEMPRPGSVPPLADRWLAELAELRQGGPTERYLIRVRIEANRDDVARAHLHRRGQVADAILEPLLGWLLTEEERHPPRPLPPPGWVAAAVALYPLDAAPGALPDAIASFAAVGLVDALAAQHDEVDVRGVVAPGHGLVLVLDDGMVLAAREPAHPPPPVFAGSWRLPG